MGTYLSLNLLTIFISTTVVKCKRYVSKLLELLLQETFSQRVSFGNLLRESKEVVGSLPCIVTDLSYLNLYLLVDKYQNVYCLAEVSTRMI